MSDLQRPEYLCAICAQVVAPELLVPSPKELAPAGLCRVASVCSPFSRPQAVAPRPLWTVEVAPAGLCRVASCLHGPRQWLPVPCGGCPRRPLSRRLLSSRPQVAAPYPRPFLGFFGGHRAGLDSSSSAQAVVLCPQPCLGRLATPSPAFYRPGWQRCGWIWRLQVFFLFNF